MRRVSLCCSIDESVKGASLEMETLMGKKCAAYLMEALVLEVMVLRSQTLSTENYRGLFWTVRQQIVQNEEMNKKESRQTLLVFFTLPMMEERRR